MKIEGVECIPVLDRRGLRENQHQGITVHLDEHAVHLDEHAVHLDEHAVHEDGWRGTLTCAR